MTDAYQPTVQPPPPEEATAPGYRPGTPGQPTQVTIPWWARKDKPLPPPKPGGGAGGAGALPDDIDPSWAKAGFSAKPAGGAPRAAPPTTPTEDIDPSWTKAGFTQTPTPPVRTEPPSVGEAIGRGAMESATFGLQPTIEAAQTVGAASPIAQAMVGVPSEAPGMEAIGAGLAATDPQSADLYEQTRARAQAMETETAAARPASYLGGEALGGLATPGFGAGTAGRLGARLATGAVSGAIGGGIYGAGEAISAGEDPGQVVWDTLRGAGIGAVTGAGFKGLVGPRVRAAPTTPGQRAAETAATRLETPLPIGIASDWPGVQGLTAKLQAAPIFGGRISRKVANVREAAGEYIADMARDLVGGPVSRGITNVLSIPVLEGVIGANRRTINRAYATFNGLINQTAEFAMPRTIAALRGIGQRRAAAGIHDTMRGLEQFVMVAQGATVQGQRDARHAALLLGSQGEIHSGLAKADFDILKRAMNGDLDHNVQRAAAANLQNPRRALDAFHRAEQTFGHLKEQNLELQELIDKRGQGAVNTILRATTEKAGDLGLLRRLRQTLPQDAWDRISGQVLHELGRGGPGGEFSFGTFVSKWRRDTADSVKDVLFSPQHRQAIEDIVNLSSHITGALRQENVSRTAAGILLLELLGNLGELGQEFATTGDISYSGHAAVSAAIPAALAFVLGNNARAASTARWMRTFNGARIQPTPGRIATFKLATRNMANTLGVDADKMWMQVEGSLAGRPQGPDTDQGQATEQK